MEKIIVFGVGGYYKKYADRIDLFNNKIIAFMDNNPNMIGKTFENKIIVNPKDVDNLEYDKIILMSSFENEIVHQLLRLNVKENKIYVYDEYSQEFRNNWQIYGSSDYLKYIGDQDYRKILLISHELTSTGAPMALRYLAQALKEEGYIPIIISPQNGPLVNEFLKLNITVIIAPVLCIEGSNFEKLVNLSDMIIVNTLVLYSVVKDLSNLHTNVVWWLHEGKYVYDIYAEKVSKKLGQNVNVFAVGKYAEQFWIKLGTNIEPGILLYGIPDKLQKYSHLSYVNEDKIIFSIVGTIDKRKGQDIFIKAVNTISKEYRKKAEFWIIGKTIDLDFKSQLVSAAFGIEEIKFFDEMANDSLFSIYDKSSVIVSASRDDPMPVVLTEGMMMEKSCICSNNTGTASLIDNWENGVAFQSEDYVDLGKIMMEIINNVNLVVKMGKNARITYEENFMYDTFKMKLSQEIKKMLF